MNNSIIDQIMKEAEPQEINFSPHTASYQELLELMKKYQKELKDIIPKENQEKVDMLVSTILKLSDEENYESYRQGFSYGVRLTAEAFLIGQDTDERRKGTV